MKAVMISINKPHTDNIRAGLKLWEIRKSKPNIPVPFSAFIYETKRNGGCGKVIGEFICDRIKMDIIGYKNGEPAYWDLLEGSCLTKEQLYEYGGWKTLYGWHISDLKIYDQPKELSEFMRPYVDEYFILNGGSMVDYEHRAKFIMRRPFQSWGYVEKFV